MKRFLARLLATLAIVAFALLAIVRLSPDHDPQRALTRRYSPVVSVLRIPRPDLGVRVERWRIVTAAGDTLAALWRSAAPGHDSPWTIVLLGGIGTDERAVLVVPSETPANVLAMSWPWYGPRRMSTLRFLAELPAIREACLRSPAVLAAGVEATARQPEVNGEHIAILGVSLGVPSALAAMNLNDTARALMLIDGGADLDDLVRHELMRQYHVPAAIASLAAKTAAWLVAPLEPWRHAEAARSRRVLLLNARRDERMPQGAAERLHTLLPGAQAETRDAVHIGPNQAAAIAELTERAVRWLESAPASPP